MAFLYKVYIADKIKEEKFKDKYGKKYKLKIDVQYQYRYKSTKIDVAFTADKKAFWMFKYKGDYYMNIIDEIDLGDKYYILDIFMTLIENATETHNFLTGMQKEKKKRK
mgnify:CR=1 FL=1